MEYRPWNSNFELIRCFSLCGTDHHSPLFMASLVIEEVESLKILDFHYDRKFILNAMIFSIIYLFPPLYGSFISCEPIFKS